MRTRQAIAVLGIAVFAFTASATASDAASPSGKTDSGSIVVGGRVLGAKQGLSVIEETYVETPGDAPVGYNAPAAPGTVSPMWVEGTSFAYSQEKLSYFYNGFGRAGGNIVNGLRIVRVCYWWTRGTATSTTYCADAAFIGGRYSPGPEVDGHYEDTLIPNAPQTIFHVEVSRIDPRY